MRGIRFGLLLGSLSACVQVGLPQDSEPEASGGAAGAAGAKGSAGANASGVNCGVDPSSGISLCLGISSCPTVRVDPDQFPECGYRISGSRIDLQCLCGDSLCPMGAAASCLDAKALLNEQSAQGVCAGIAEGRCEQVRQTGSSTRVTCNKDCRAQCSGVPGCTQLCGC